MNHQGVADAKAAVLIPLQDEGTTNVTAVEEAEDDPSKAGKNGLPKAEEESLSLDCFTCFFLGLPG